jgi:uroporphyrinogen-III decarboxylase
LLDGFVIWGDVAYKKATFVSPAFWREYFKPWVAAMTAEIHRHGLPVIYHGCGNVQAIFEDFIDLGIEAFNPLEAKAGLDVVELRRRYGHRMAFCGNSDIRIWESGDRAALRHEILRKLEAARGGGYLFQSDHSVTSSVSGATYDFIVKLVQEFGRYPIKGTKT